MNQQSNTPKKQRLLEEIKDSPDDSVLAELSKTFEEKVLSRLRNTEDQLRDASNRLEAEIGELELVVCLAENRIAMTLNPRYEELAQELECAIKKLEECIQTSGVFHGD